MYVIDNIATFPGIYPFFLALLSLEVKDPSSLGVNTWLSWLHTHFWVQQTSEVSSTNLDEARWMLVRLSSPITPKRELNTFQLQSSSLLTMVHHQDDPVEYHPQKNHLKQKKKSQGKRPGCIVNFITKLLPGPHHVNAIFTHNHKDLQKTHTPEIFFWQSKVILLLDSWNFLLANDQVRYMC